MRKLTRSASFDVALFSAANAAKADSRGRQPTVVGDMDRFSREAATASQLKTSLSPLRGFCRIFQLILGLTPKAICCHRFAINEKRNFKKRERGRALPKACECGRIGALALAHASG
jgi:hypothetical protein